MLHLSTRFAASRAVSRRSLSTDALAALDAWNPQRAVQHDTFHATRLADLFATLPTRNDTASSHLTKPLEDGDALPYGHHLVFFHPRTPEHHLRSDGTDGGFCPPPPFVRRMWAGGRIVWHNYAHVGAPASAICSVASVERKGFGGSGTPLVFVKQRIEVTTPEGHAAPDIVEERTHVYIPLEIEQRRAARKVDGLPRADFEYAYTPTPTTLFRFSALTFNAHRIHLDREYAQREEGYPERLIHAPLTALMMLETLVLHRPDTRLTAFEYRAVNPVVVGRRCVIRGAWEGDGAATLWVEDEDGVVGMTGKATFE